MPGREVVLRGRVEADFFAAALFEHLIFMGNVYTKGVNKTYVLLLPRIHGTPEHLKSLHLTAQFPLQFFRELRLRLPGTKPQTLNLKHR